MAAQADDWLIDFIQGVFSAPTWQGPLADFVDTHCWDIDDSDENKLSYTELHRKFTELVETLLEEHLLQVGMEADDFVSICYSQHGNPAFYSLVLEPLLSADDFVTFKKMMVRRQKELALQAAQMISDHDEMAIARVRPTAPPAGTGSGSARAGIATAATAAGSAAPAAHTAAASSLSSSRADDDVEYRAAVAASLAEADAARRVAEYELAMLEAALAASLALEEERLRLLQEVESADLQEAIRLSQERAAGSTPMLLLPPRQPLPLLL